LGAQPPISSSEIIRSRLIILKTKINIRNYLGGAGFQPAMPGSQTGTRARMNPDMAG
jgi:hypothetical protein